MARRIRERDVEAYLVKRVEALGGTAEKFSSPNRRSVPDRLISWPRSRILMVADGKIEHVGSVQFVECKAPGEKPTPAQERDHERRRQMGFVVGVVDTHVAVDIFLEAYGP